MKALYRFLAIVSYEHINEMLVKYIQENEEIRNNKRKEALEKVNQINVKDKTDECVKILTELNDEINHSYEKENLLRDFVNNLKK